MQPVRQVPLAVTLAPLGDPASAMAWAAGRGIRGIQLSASHPQTRPRDLGASARRDLRAMVARHELVVSGIDLWIPAGHFVEAAHADRAIDAVRAACDLAGEMGRVAVTLELPLEGTDEAAASRAHEAVAAVAAAADRAGVLVADAAGAAGCPWPPIGICVDPARELSDGADPALAASRAGGRLVGARLVDLTRSGMRGPPDGGTGSRLDLLGFRIALETAGFRGLPVIDARQWADPHAGTEACVRAWQALLPQA